MKQLINPAEGSSLSKWPAGNVYQFFAENVAEYLKAIGTNGHNGLDIAMTEGTPILASEGIVCEVNDSPAGYGKHVRIKTIPDSDGNYLELTYGHGKNISVKIGDNVKDSQKIMEMSNTGFVISGNTTYWGNAPAGKGVHLHFGVRECSIKNTGWITTYSDGSHSYIKNYDNGFKGSVDPMKFLEQSKESLTQNTDQSYTPEQLQNFSKQLTIIQKIVNLLFSWYNKK
jgi:murein DD-endopeptidase MepM/ murein hydrolase activator NlpD